MRVSRLWTMPRGCGQTPIHPSKSGLEDSRLMVIMQIRRTKYRLPLTLARGKAYARLLPCFLRNH